MRAAAYNLEQFAPAGQARKPEIGIVTNPRGKNRAFRVRVVSLSLLLLVLMSMMVYNNMLLTETKTKVNAANDALVRLDAEYTFLNYQLESRVSLKNAEDYAVLELGLVKLAPSQIEYVNLRGDSEIVVEGGEETGWLERVFDAVVRFFGG